MNLSAPFIRRPVGTLLLTAALVLAGLVGYRLLPVAALPRIDIPTISVSASLPGASPETMANTVSTPLIQELATIPSIRAISATNLQGSSSITLEFALDRDIDMAAADVQAALARAQRGLPAEMTIPPIYRKLNPADAPVILLVLKSDTEPLWRLDQFARTLISPRLAAVPGVGQVSINGSQKYAVRIRLDPHALAARRIGVDEIERAVRAANSEAPARLPRWTHAAAHHRYPDTTWRRECLARPDHCDAERAVDSPRRCRTGDQLGRGRSDCRPA